MIFIERGNSASHLIDSHDTILYSPNYHSLSLILNTNKSASPSFDTNRQSTFRVYQNPSLILAENYEIYSSTPLKPLRLINPILKLVEYFANEPLQKRIKKHLSEQIEVIIELNAEWQRLDPRVVNLELCRSKRRTPKTIFRGGLSQRSLAKEYYE